MSVVGVQVPFCGAGSLLRLARLANDKGVDFSTLVNNMLRKDIELIEMAK